MHNNRRYLPPWLKHPFPDMPPLKAVDTLQTAGPREPLTTFKAGSVCTDQNEGTKGTFLKLARHVGLGREEERRGREQTGEKRERERARV